MTRVRVSFECDIEEEDFKLDEYYQQKSATEIGAPHNGTIFIPKDAKIERVIDLPVGTVIRSKDGSILEWKAGDGRWYWVGTEPDGSGKEAHRYWGDEEAQRAIEHPGGSCEIIYKPGS